MWIHKTKSVLEREYTSSCMLVLHLCSVMVASQHLVLAVQVHENCVATSL